MADFKIRIEDHSGDVLRKLEQNKVKVLEACGQTAATHAKNIITRFSRVDTDAMRGSINHQVQESESAVYVGTNSEYAAYHELGTGVYHDTSDGKQGRQGWWVYVPGDESHKVGSGKIYTKAEAIRIMMALRAKGLDAHITQGIKPIHMLKNSLDHFQADYKKIIKEELKEMEE